MSNHLEREQTNNMICNLVSKILRYKLNANKDIDCINPISDLFKGKKKTNVLLEDFILRLNKYLKFEFNTIVIAMILLERFCEKNKFCINEFIVHRLVLVSLLIAIKFNEDKHYTNKFVAKVGGVKVKNLNLMESNFLKSIDYSIYVEYDSLNVYWEKNYKKCMK